MCFLDYDRDIMLVAVCQHPETGKNQLLAVGRLSRRHDSHDAEFALRIRDAWQGYGLGQELLRRISADILGENTAIQRVAKPVGFTRTRVAGGDYRAELAL